MRLHNLPLALFVLTMFAVALGGSVRIHDAGESCPDWPQCFGSWSFDISEEEQRTWYEAHPDEIDSRGSDVTYTTFEIFLEWGHRVVTGLLLGPLCILQWFVAFRRKEKMPEVHKASIIALVLVVVQGILGYITVRYDNVHWSVAAHLVLALALALSLLWAWLRWMEAEGLSIPRASKKNQKRLIDLSVGTLVVLVLGAFVAAIEGQNGACSVGSFAAWPLCNGSLYASLTENLQFVHRIAVILVAVSLFASLREMDGITRKWVHAGVGIYTLNLLLGGAYILTASAGFIEWLSLLHLLAGSTAFLCIAFAAMLTFGPETDEEE